MLWRGRTPLGKREAFGPPGVGGGHERHRRRHRIESCARVKATKYYIPLRTHASPIPACGHLEALHEHSDCCPYDRAPNAGHLLAPERDQRVGVVREREPSWQAGGGEREAESGRWLAATN